MEIRCPGCSRKYIIPDERLADRLAYFSCDSCGERVVVRPRAARAAGSRPLKDTFVSAGDILDGFRLSFNLKNCIVALTGLLGIILVLMLAAALAAAFPSLYAARPALGAALATIVFLLCVFIFDVTLYLISKNVSHRVETGADIRFGEAGEALRNDLVTVSLVSVGLPAAAIVIALPLLLIPAGHVLYIGVTYPFLIGLLVALAFALVFKNFLMAYIAASPGLPSRTLAGIPRFFARENVNILLYMVLIRILTGVFAVLVLIIPVASVFLVAGFSSAAGSGMLLKQSGLLSGDMSALVPGITGALQLDVRIGMVLVALFSGALLLIFGAYILSLWQTLTSVSIAIMESNPGRSISRTAVLAWIILAAVVAWGAIGIALAVSGVALLIR